LTIASATNRISMDGNGSTTAFPVAFPFQAQADLTVLSTVIATGVQTLQTITTHYTISGVIDALGHYANGGSVDFLVAPASTVRITIYRDPSPTQGLDLVENDNLPAESVEAQLDYVTMLVQRVRDLISRSLRQPDGDVDAIGTLPSKVDRASKFLACNANGDPIAAAGTSANLGPVSAFINTLLPAADSTAARAILEIGTDLPDITFRIVGSSDATKKVAREVDGLTTATTRTRFEADEDSTEGQGWDIKNLSLVATVGANALTIALKTKSGSDPSAINPIIVKFRNATLGTGDYTIVALTAALSLVISSGSTLGTVSGVAHRLYLGLANDGGTLRLFLYNPLVAATLSLAGLHDAQVYSSTAEGGTGAADSAQVLYSGTAFTSKAIRLLGYVESTQATAGTWATTPSKIQLLGPGVKRTADRLQTQVLADGAVATGTTVLPSDDTIPQNTEGDQYLTKSITPTSSLNLLHIETLLALASSTNDQATVALFQDASANALAAMQNTFDTTGRVYPVALEHWMVAGTVSSITFNVRAGNTAAGTTTFNGAAGARKMGGVMKSFLRITEIMV
jgi:hypothetical protein